MLIRIKNLLTAETQRIFSASLCLCGEIFLSKNIYSQLKFSAKNRFLILLSRRIFAFAIFTLFAFDVAGGQPFSEFLRVVAVMVF